MLFEAGDFIYQPGSKSYEETLSHIRKKYAEFFFKYDHENTLHEMIDVRNKNELKRIIKMDATRIVNTIKKLREEGVKNIEVQHCYTPDGQGYYSIYSTESNIRRFVKSDYELSIHGGIWSYSVWRRFCSADVLLFWFLEQVRKRIRVEYKSVKMVIRHLYLPYITKENDYSRNVFDSDGLKVMQNIIPFINEYTEIHQAEYEEYITSKKNWYNGDGNDSYYVIEKILQQAVNNIYERKDDLKACDLWDKANAVKNILYDMKYKRDMYTYLRKYDEPQRKHKLFKNILKRCFQKERIT